METSENRTAAIALWDKVARCLQATEMHARMNADYDDPDEVKAAYRARVKAYNELRAMILKEDAR